VLFGVGGGAAYILVQQMVNLVVTRRRGLVNGYIVSLLPAGAMIAAPVFGWAIGGFGVRATLGGFAAVLAVTGFASACLVSGAGVAGSGATGSVTLSPDERRRAVFWRLSLVFFLAASAGRTPLGSARSAPAPQPVPASTLGAPAAPPPSRPHDAWPWPTSQDGITASIVRPVRLGVKVGFTGRLQDRQGPRPHAPSYIERIR
jgi:hypothetical protein